MTTIKCISLTQPWATLVAIGAKQIETRSWSTVYRGPLAIHAAKEMPPEAVRQSFSEPFYSALRMKENGDRWPMPKGAIIAVCDLVDMARITADNAPPEPERSFGNYTPGRWGWCLANIRRLPQPIPYRGHQGIRDVAPDVARQLLEG